MSAKERSGGNKNKAHLFHILLDWKPSHHFTDRKIRGKEELIFKKKSMERQLFCRQVVAVSINNTYAAYTNFIIFCLTLHAHNK